MKNWAGYPNGLFYMGTDYPATIADVNADGAYEIIIVGGVFSNPGCMERRLSAALYERRSFTIWTGRASTTEPTIGKAACRRAARP